MAEPKPMGLHPLGPSCSIPASDCPVRQEVAFFPENQPLALIPQGKCAAHDA
jgi:hypothetical protein